MRVIQSCTLLLLGVLGCREPDKTPPVYYTNDSYGINNLVLKDSNGKPLDMGKYKGKTVFINLWATWCKPCVEEMPSIQKAQNILSSAPVIFLLASGETAAEIHDFRISHPYKFVYTHIENMEELNVQALPTTLIFNPQGKLVFSEMGTRNWDDSNNIRMILKITKQHD